MSMNMNANIERTNPSLIYMPPSYPSRCLNFLKAANRETSEELEEVYPPKSSVRLDILIVGAGIGGLATAVALARRGHKVKVFEQAPALGEVGAGIQLPPNSARLLNRWGLGKYLLPFTNEPKRIVIRRWQSGEEIGLTQLRPNFRQCFRAPYYVIHRAHLHEALHQAARNLGVVVQLDACAVDYNLDATSLTLRDGSTHQADLIIGADGLKSKARAKILGAYDDLPKAVGFAAYRATVDVEKMKADPDTAQLLNHSDLNLWIGPMRHVMTYTIASGSSFNMVLSHPEANDPSTWSQGTALKDMGDQFTGWDPRLVKVINMIDKTMKWPLLSGTPLPHWVAPSGRCLILGDAAHAMVPYMSQGAAMAVEDGAALAAILHEISSRSDLRMAINLFEKVRMQRSYQMQEASLLNSKLWHLPDGPLQQARDEAMRNEVEGKPFVDSPNQWSDPVTQDWAYGYDAEEAMKEAWSNVSASVRHLTSQPSQKL